MKGRLMIVFAITMAIGHLSFLSSSHARSWESFLEGKFEGHTYDCYVNLVPTETTMKLDLTWSKDDEWLQGSLDLGIPGYQYSIQIEKFANGSPPWRMALKNANYQRRLRSEHDETTLNFIPPPGDTEPVIVYLVRSEPDTLDVIFKYTSVENSLRGQTICQGQMARVQKSY